MRHVIPPPRSFAKLSNMWRPRRSDEACFRLPLEESLVFTVCHAHRGLIQKHSSMMYFSMNSKGQRTIVSEILSIDSFRISRVLCTIKGMDGVHQVLTDISADGQHCIWSIRCNTSRQSNRKNCDYLLDWLCECERKGRLGIVGVDP